MNRYGSSIRFLQARNCFEGIISPPNDLTIAFGDWQEQLFTTVQLQNPNANFTIKSLGINSNFADGLIFKEPEDRVDIIVISRGLVHGAAITGTVNLTEGDKTLSGGGTTQFVTDGVSAGDFLLIGGRLYLVASVTDEDNLELSDYAKLTAAAQTCRETTLAGSFSFLFENTSMFNFMHPVEEFIPLTSLLGSEADSVVITAKVNQNFDSVNRHSVSFLTKTINTDFDGDKIYIDVIGEFEFQRS